MKRPIMAAFLLALSLLAPVNAQFARQTDQAGSTSALANIANTSTTITLDAPCRKVTVWTYSDSAAIHVNFKGNAAATTSNAKIAPGASYTWGGPNAEPITTFRYIGASATGQLSYVGEP